MANRNLSLMCQKKYVLYLQASDTMDLSFHDLNKEDEDEGIEEDVKIISDA